jgi:hypothetical protein
MRVKALVAEFPEGAEKEAKKCLFDLGQSLVVAHREIDERCTHLAYLFSEYEPRCGYFECVECFRRIALTGFMVLYDDDSIGKIYTAALLSLVFSVIYAYLSPYDDDSTDRFATAMSAMLFLQLFLTIMLYAETHIVDADVRAGWSPDQFGKLMTILAVAAGPFEAFAELCMEAQIDPASAAVAAGALVAGWYYGRRPEDDGGDVEAAPAGVELKLAESDRAPAAARAEARFRAGRPPKKKRPKRKSAAAAARAEACLRAGDPPEEGRAEETGDEPACDIVSCVLGNL